MQKLSLFYFFVVDFQRNEILLYYYRINRFDRFGHVGRRGMCRERVKCKREAILRLSLSWGDPGEARTHDPMIKSHLLYQLSYGVIVGFLLLLGKVTAFFLITQIFLRFFFKTSQKPFQIRLPLPYPLLSKLCTLHSKTYTPLSKKSRMAAAIISRPKIA